MVNTLAPDLKSLISAVVAYDFERVRALVAEGADVNGTDEAGDTVLMCAVGDTDNDDPLLRLAMVRELLSLGADPCKRHEDGSGPLCEAAARMDTEVLRLLMDAGAHPNDETGWEPGRNAYDLAAEDYYIDTWIGPGGFSANGRGLPEEPGPGDVATPEAWLGFLDRMAVKYSKRRPDHLYLMRERGARGVAELKS
jgi:Ankyrin repeats (3 copies)